MLLKFLNSCALKYIILEKKILNCGGLKTRVSIKKIIINALEIKKQKNDTYLIFISILKLIK